ncbi:MAG: DNA polymerase III subunit delta' [SAR86 cluster bacterium]|jgi:DNA polymerase III subunit delta'|uniref:DNA polymerase III subunit delta' n=1 Tax=SAR86 cluster bacterium TaxID=2030880 RepID=A0A973AAG4_9GAMM|nr:DNA polymerase III subunit delta' [SAR86 cluster bacterium]|tara:strand:- start:20153 stop:21187 length:1035 start_codon:yes stop_codon:yes gene_type:complete
MMAQADLVQPEQVTRAQFYPWQTLPRQQIARQYRQDKLPHALLLCGQADLGKRDFANAMAQLLLCRAPIAEKACGDCPECALIDAGTHPDLRIVQPEGTSKQIKIDQVRSLIEWSGHTAQRNGLKIAIIHPAETMNNATSNALLKCLEEPAGSTLMMLVTRQPARLLPTIRSRCQRVNFALPSPELVLPWLAERLPDNQNLALLLNIAGGAPLAVLDHHDEQYLARRQTIAKGLAALLTAVSSAAETYVMLAPDDPLMVVNLMLEVVADALRWQVSEVDGAIKNQDLVSSIKLIGQSVSKDFLFRLLDRLMQEARQLASTSNPSPQLLLEALLDAVSHRQVEVF